MLLVVELHQEHHLPHMVLEHLQAVVVVHLVHQIEAVEAVALLLYQVLGQGVLVVLDLYVFDTQHTIHKINNR
jgi:hypothetical protein